MLKSLERLTQRVGGSNELIDQWLCAREELLVAYYALIGLKPNKEKHTPLNENALENFCHCLVDYLSAGHFHVYDRIVKDVVGADSSAMLITSKIYPALQQNTATIMAFHDSYTDTHIDDDQVYDLHQALSDIGEALEARFIQEDQLITLAADFTAIARQPVSNNSDLARPA
ncbi:sigma D regulator [Edaphovirga cremea]|uniref:sigma D regulator n=1 Tax=Edaphovirga cremea TaxID=2267246 RepID=UPI000DEEE670|nr:sigma D regulator [Edaphovirga cremea]